MSGSIKEWFLVLIAISAVGVLGFFAKKLNDDSFNEVAKVEYIVTSRVANLRSGPSTDYKILRTIKHDHVLDILEVKGSWLRVSHRRSKTKGWMHRSVMGRFFVIRYYKELYLDHGVVELNW